MMKQDEVIIWRKKLFFFQLHSQLTQRTSECMKPGRIIWSADAVWSWRLLQDCVLLVQLPGLQDIREQLARLRSLRYHVNWHIASGIKWSSFRKKSVELNSVHGHLELSTSTIEFITLPQTCPSSLSFPDNYHRALYHLSRHLKISLHLSLIFYIKLTIQVTLILPLCHLPYMLLLMNLIASTLS